MSRLVFVLVAVVVLSGCGERDSGVPYARLPADAVVASVGGEMYTKSDLERDCGITADVLKLAGADEAEIPAVADPEGFRRSLVPRVINRELLVQEANRRRVTLTPAEFSEYQELFAAKLAGNVPMTFRAIVETLGPRSTAFRANLRRDALALKLDRLVRREIAAQAQVLPDDTAREQDRVRKFNGEVAITNAAIRTAANRTWRSIQRGNDFDTVGRKLLELRGDVAYAADCVETNAAFAKLGVGKVAPPLEVGSDIVILKALGPDSDGRRHFGKIAYSLLRPLAVPTAEDALKAAREKKIDAGYLAWLDGLRRRTKIYNRFAP